MSTPRLHTAAAVESSTKPSDEIFRPRPIQPLGVVLVDVNLCLVIFCDAAKILPRSSGNVSAYILSIFERVYVYAHQVLLYFEKYKNQRGYLQ